MIRCKLQFYPLNFYAPFIAPDGADTGPLRHAMYSDAAEPETLPLAPVCLCLLPKDPDALPEDYRKVAEAEGIERAVCDYIAGMTDQYAVSVFEQRYVPAGWSGR